MVLVSFNFRKIFSNSNPMLEMLSPKRNQIKVKSNSNYPPFQLGNGVKAWVNKLFSPRLPVKASQTSILQRNTAKQC